MMNDQGVRTTPSRSVHEIAFSQGLELFGHSGHRMLLDGYQLFTCQLEN